MAMTQSIYAPKLTRKLTKGQISLPILAFLDQVARQAHETQRAYLDEYSKVTSAPFLSEGWDDLAPTIKMEMIEDVAFIKGQSNVTPELFWLTWRSDRMLDGWAHGPFYDATTKKDHLLVDEYSKLSNQERMRLFLYVTTIKGALKATLPLSETNVELSKRVNKQEIRLAEMEEELREQRGYKDGAYEERNKVVRMLAALFPSGIAKTVIDGWDPEWHHCVYIDTPAGQVSWHFHESQLPLFKDLPRYQGKWDGHTTEEKYTRLRILAKTFDGNSNLRMIKDAIRHEVETH